MPRARIRAAFALTLVALALPAPASASGFRDEKTGLVVDPPQPFVVAPAKSPSYDVVAIVNSLAGKPSLGPGDSYLCQIGFKAEADSADLSQEEINLQVAQPGWLDNVAQALSRSFDVVAKQTFVLGGATGIELVGKPKNNGPGAGVFISMIDTPAGRTTINCATRLDELDGALNPFRLIRAGVTPPTAPAKP
jgi:hypothetical protein